MDKELFAALQREEPAISLSELGAFTHRKVRGRKLKVRAFVALIVAALALSPFVLDHAPTADSPKLTSLSSQENTAIQPAPSVDRSSEPISAVTVTRASHSASQRRQTKQFETASIATEGGTKALITESLLQLNALEPPGIRESILSSFSANTSIQ